MPGCASSSAAKDHVQLYDLDPIAMLRWLECADKVHRHRTKRGARMTPEAVRLWVPIFQVKATDAVIAKLVGCPTSTVFDARHRVDLLAQAGGRGDDTVRLIPRGRR